MTLVEVPLNVSGFWIPVIGSSHLDTGSLGASLTLHPPVVFRVSRSISPVSINGVYLEDYHKVSEYLSNRGVSLYGNSPIPLGAGSAVSGALAIALAYTYLSLTEGVDPSTRSIGILAHRIELDTRGGLGDVICQLTGGGLVLRRRAGPPGYGEAVRVPVEEDVEISLGLLSRRLTTREMLERYWDTFVKAGREAYAAFLLRPSLRTFLEVSRRFSAEVGFLTPEIASKLDNALAPLSGKVMGYFIKKSLVVVAHEPGLSEALRDRLAKGLCYYVATPFRLAREGARLTQVTAVEYFKEE